MQEKEAAGDGEDGAAARGRRIRNLRPERHGLCWAGPEETDTHMGPTWAGPEETVSCSGGPLIWAGRRLRSPPLHEGRGLFFFYIFKKIKISKIYVRFEIFQKYSPVAPHRATGPKYNFFSSNLQRGPWKKNGGPVAPPRATTGPSPRARQGGLSPPSGDRSNPLI